MIPKKLVGLIYEGLNTSCSGKVYFNPTFCRYEVTKINGDVKGWSKSLPVLKGHTMQVFFMNPTYLSVDLGNACAE